MIRDCFSNDTASVNQLRYLKYQQSSFCVKKIRLKFCTRVPFQTSLHCILKIIVFMSNTKINIKNKAE